MGGRGLERRSGRLLDRELREQTRGWGHSHFLSPDGLARQEGPEIYVVQIGKETWGKEESREGEVQSSPAQA